jgi:hypothetical protein
MEQKKMGVKFSLQKQLENYYSEVTKESSEFRGLPTRKFFYGSWLPGKFNS